MKTVIVYRDCLLGISETFIAEQVGALQSFQPQYLALRPSNPSLDFKGKPLYLAHGLGLFSKMRSRLYKHIPVAPLFHRRVRSLDAKLIHAHFAPDGAYISRLAEELGLPLIVTLHGYDVTQSRNLSARYAKLWERAALYLCVSDFIRRKAIEVGFPAEKLRVHHIGIDLTKFHPPSTPRVPGLILFVGRLVEVKGCETLLRAMETVHRAVHTASLVVIGDGPLRPVLTDLASALHLRCQFLGNQPHAKVQEWMRKASIYCAPSQTVGGYAEALGMTYLEAQASGLPVVSTRSGGIPEAVVDGKTALLVPERDVAALAAALTRYLTDSDLAFEHGSAGRPWVAKEFDIVKQTVLLEQIYEGLLPAR